MDSVKTSHNRERCPDRQKQADKARSCYIDDDKLEISYEENFEQFVKRIYYIKTYTLYVFSKLFNY